MVDAALVEDEEVVTLTDVEAVMADAALVEDEEVVTLTDVEAVMAETEVDVILTDVEVEMVDAALAETGMDEILTDVEAVMVDVITEAVMTIAQTNVIGKHAESAQVTLTIVVQNQFDHVVTKEIIETIEVNSVDSRSTLS